MNRNLVEYNDNHGASIDEYGNITMITKDKTDYNFEEILQKENKLEILNDDLDVANREYADRKHNLKNGKICNVAVLLGTSLMVGLCLNTHTPIQGTLIICGGFAGFTKLLSSSISGFAIINKKQLRELNHKIYELENEIPKLEKEISDIKEKVNYTTLSDDSSKYNYQELSFANIYTQNEEKNVGKVRVLKLR